MWRAGGAGLGVLLVLVVFGAGVLAMLAALNPLPGDAAGVGGSAVGDIPAGSLALYAAAARSCPGLDWSVLAAIGKLETDHGRSTLPGVHGGANSAGSEGIMQFQPATWAAVIARHPIPPGGADPPSPYNPHDAIYAAAAYLCDNGAGNPATLARAVWAYNHSQSYVSAVLAQAQKYRTQQYRAQQHAVSPGNTPDPTGTTPGGGPDQAAGGAGGVGGSTANGLALDLIVERRAGRRFVFG